MKWFIENWSKLTLFLAVYVTILLVLFVMKQDFALFLIWIQMPIYFIHQFEEYVLPGGFIAFFNTKLLGSTKTDFPLDKKKAFWINVPIVFICFPISAIFATQFDLSFGIWTAYFSIVNGIVHVGSFPKHRYNPGFLASLLLNIPVGAFTIYYFASHQIISLNAHIIGLFIALTVHGLLVFYGFKILKPQVK